MFNYPGLVVRVPPSWVIGLPKRSAGPRSTDFRRGMDAKHSIDHHRCVCHNEENEGPTVARERTHRCTRSPPSKLGLEKWSQMVSIGDLAVRGAGSRIRQQAKRLSTQSPESKDLGAVETAKASCEVPGESIGPLEHGTDSADLRSSWATWEVQDHLFSEQTRIKKSCGVYPHPSYMYVDVRGGYS